MAIRALEHVPVVALDEAESLPWKGVGAEDFPFEHQQAGNWCWAACTSMVRTAKNVPRSQCEIVHDHITGAAGCCEDPESDVCNQAATETKFGFALREVSPDFDDEVPANAGWLSAWLNRGPVVAIWRWRDQSLSVREHAVLVVAWRDGPDSKQFKVHDPRHSSYDILDFDALSTANGSGAWHTAWVNL